MQRSSCFALFVLFATAAPVHAGGLIHTLPADGSWVKYNMSMKNEGMVSIEGKGSLTIRLVGTVTENGEKYRWVELESVAMQNGQQKAGVMKLLIREKDLADGAVASPQIVRGFKKQQGGAVESITERDKARGGSAMMFFGRPQKNVKPLNQEKVVAHQKGKLKIANGTSGELDFDPTGGAGNPNGAQFETTQSLWSHKSLPFGTAAMELVMKVSFQNNVISTMTMKFNVQDYGTAAKSALPDQK